jgi:YVTN family beta-propeller protein
LHSDRIVKVSSFASLSLLLLAGCGSTYRPVVSSINPVGPAGQPTKYVVAISSTGATTPGISTLVDYSGDTVVNTVQVGVNPQYMQIDTSGSYVYTLNGDGTVNSFGISSSLLQSQVNTTTLPANSAPISISSQGTNLYLIQSGLNETAQLTTGAPPTLKQELPTGPGTIYTVSTANAPRVYALVQNGTSAGHAAAIETATTTISNSIPVGVQPVYGVMTADTRRAFVMNRGSNTVSVINTQTNALDSFVSSTPGTIPVGPAPVWADFAPTLNQLLVLNQGDGINPGSVSIIQIPLCSALTVVSNPNCDVNNPVDAAGFGTVLATIPVGVNPQQIAVLQDGSQAFVSNMGNANTPGSVSVINLTTQSVVATIPAGASTNEADGLIHGHPNFIAATTGTPTGKVYVTAGDSHDLTIIRTDTDAVLTHVSLQGNGVIVRVNLP